MGGDIDEGRCQKRKCVSADLSLSFGHGRFLGERGSQEAHRNRLALSRNEKISQNPNDLPSRSSGACEKTEALYFLQVATLTKLFDKTVQIRGSCVIEQAGHVRRREKKS